MTIKKLNDEELDMVTGGSLFENRDLGIYINFGKGNISGKANWLKTNLNIDCSLSDELYTNNKYSITINGETRTLKHEEVLGMIKEYWKQHPNG